MTSINDLFDHHASFDPACDFSDFIKSIPPRGAVCLLSNATHDPVQLLSTANLRRYVQKRLSPPPDNTSITPHTDYRALIRNLHWRGVEGTFEADLTFLEIARTIFPDQYQGMIGFKSAWWIQVDPESDFPRYTRTAEPSEKNGLIFGPLHDKHAAARLIELTEDLFDLCRYHHILIQAPHGKACAYKEMGKCPAPCDGSISMDAYRAMIDWSAQSLSDPAAFIADLQQRMMQAARELHFEDAAKIKSLIDEADQLDKGAFRHVRPMPQFIYVSLQPAHRKGCVKLYVIACGQIREMMVFLRQPQWSTVIPIIRQVVGETINAPGSHPVAWERMALVAHHLFARRTQGFFLHQADWNEKSLQSLWRRVQKLPPSDAFDENAPEKTLGTI